MRFLIRSANPGDLHKIMDLSKQFNLLSLPNDEKIIFDKLDRSEKSFRGDMPIDSSEYIFILEDLESNKIIGISIVFSKHGTPQIPHNYFKVYHKTHSSSDIGFEMNHLVVRFCQDIDGPTEVGGLLVDRNHRGHSAKLGRQISLIRFLYMAMKRERFQSELLVEFAPPLTRSGKSELWEALGRRFTGMSYQDADRLSIKSKQFIRNLFPPEDIYLCMVDPVARLSVGQVSEATLPAKHLLEKIGFRYANEIDPFDGGPHYKAKTDDVTLVRNATQKRISGVKESQWTHLGLLGIEKQGHFLGCQTEYAVDGDGILVSEAVLKQLKVDLGEQVYITPIK